MFGKWTKAIFGTASAIVTWGLTAGLDGHYSGIEFWGLAGAVVAALTVAGSTNTVNGKAYVEPKP